MGAQGTGKDRQRDLVLDAGALIAFERGDQVVRALIEESSLIAQVTIPTSVLAQVWRGGSKGAVLARLIEASEIDVLDEGRAKEIGVRLGARSASDITDAHVICCALFAQAKIVTSDPVDIEALAESGESLALIAI